MKTEVSLEILLKATEDYRLNYLSGELPAQEQLPRLLNIAYELGRRDVLSNNQR